MYGAIVSEGRSWQCIKIKDGRTLKEVKADCIERLVIKELLEIPGAYRAYSRMLGTGDTMVQGFKIFIDPQLAEDALKKKDLSSDSALEKKDLSSTGELTVDSAVMQTLKEQYPILTDDIVELYEESRPKLERFQYGCKIGELPGTIGCFCKDSSTSIMG